MSKKYRKKVAPVEAVKWTGDNYEEVVAFIAGTAAAGISQWPYRGNPHENRTHYAREPRLLMIKTKHRDLYCRTGDYVIKNEIGDLQTCGGRHFEREYEEVEEQGERRVARPIHDGICVACGAPVPEGTWVCPQCKEDPFHAIKEKEHRDE